MGRGFESFRPCQKKRIAIAVLFFWQGRKDLFELTPVSGSERVGAISVFAKGKTAVFSRREIAAGAKRPWVRVLPIAVLFFGRGGRTYLNLRPRAKASGSARFRFLPKAKRRCSAAEKSQRERSDPGFESFQSRSSFYGRGGRTHLKLRPRAKASGSARFRFLPKAKRRCSAAEKSQRERKRPWVRVLRGDFSKRRPKFFFQPIAKRDFLKYNDIEPGARARFYLKA